jgi:hypothetical protein
MAGREQLGDDGGADVTGRTGDENTHGKTSWGDRPRHEAYPSDG